MTKLQHFAGAFCMRIPNNWNLIIINQTFTQQLANMWSVKNEKASFSWRFRGCFQLFCNLWSNDGVLRGEPLIVDHQSPLITNQRNSSVKDFLIYPKLYSKSFKILVCPKSRFCFKHTLDDFRVSSHTLWSFRDDCVISQLTFNPLHPARTSLFNEIHRLFACWRIWRRKQTVRVQWGWRNRRVLTPFRTHFSWFGEYRWHHSGSSRFMIPCMIREKTFTRSTRTFVQPGWC